MDTPILPMIFAGAALAVVVSLSACGESVSPEAEARYEAAEIAHEAERRLGWTAYVYDKRSELCFLRSPTTHGHHVYAPVECTPNVKKFLLNPPE